MREMSFDRSLPGRLIAAVALAAMLIAPAALAADRLSPEQAQQLLQAVDDQRRAAGDLKSTCFVEETAGDRKAIWEATFYQKPQDDRLVLLVNAPKTEAGNGYLRFERNLWSYDASLGRWDRRTDRDRIGSTNLTRSDFSSIGLSEQYQATDEGEVMFGKMKVRQLLLKAKPDQEVAYPIVRIWVDGKHVIVKSEDHALSGKLMRTTLITKIASLKSPLTHQSSWWPMEVHIYNAIDKTRTTTLLFKNISLEQLPDAYFTKAWFESKSR